MGRLREALGYDEEAINTRWEQYRELQVGIQAELVTLRHLMARWLPHELLWAGSITLDANGGASLDFAQPAFAVKVANVSANSVTVLAGPRGIPPAAGTGAGVHLVNSGMVLTCNGKTTSWSFYGTAGSVIGLQVFGHYVPDEGSTT